MSVTDTKSLSRTDWHALETMSDEEIDYSDIPPLTDSFFKRARLFVPQTASFVQLDSDILAWFKAQSQEYENAINSVLRAYMQLHEQ